MNVERVAVMLIAQDMDRAVAFYRDVVGLEARSQSERWTEFAFGDAVVALHIGGQGESNKTGLAMTVSDIDSACREVEAGGGKVLKAPYVEDHVSLKLAYLEDTEGNGFENRPAPRLICHGRALGGLRLFSLLVCGRSGQLNVSPLGR